MKMTVLIKRCIKSFGDLLYPPLCLHCKDTLNTDSSLLCKPCGNLLELIDPEQRCPYCFTQTSIANTPCEECYKRPSLFYRVASCFDYEGPAATLISQLKFSNQSYLSKGMGAYLVAQLLKLDWPIPDVIIPVPISFTHWLGRGYNQSELLANCMGNLIGRPVINALKRRSGEFSQSGLSRKQRLGTSSEYLKLKKDTVLYDKTILLIDDVYTSGNTFRKCADALIAGYPNRIYGLTFCRTMV